MKNHNNDAVTAILDGDTLYNTEMSLLTAKWRRGDVNPVQFANIRRWLVASAMARNRRAAQARARQPFNALPLPSRIRNVHTVVSNHVTA